MVLWHTKVEQLRPQQIAPLLEVSANSVAALTHHAREGLRRAYVSMHANSCSDQERGRQVVSDERCEPTSAGTECSVSSGPDPFQMTLSRTECSTYFVEVRLDEGTDPSFGNNSTRVRLGEPAIACLTTGLLDVTLKGERRVSVRH